MTDLNRGVRSIAEAALPEGRKDDESKDRWDLLPFEALREVSAVLSLGAKKYGERNWQKGMRWRRLLAAAFRHIISWSLGEGCDPESGLSHLAHAVCCLLFLISYEQKGIGIDDRE